VIKVEVVYDRPCWREDGLSGMALGDNEPVQVTFDNTPPDDKHHSGREAGRPDGVHRGKRGPTARPSLT
jgi:monoamine oxidase